MNYYGELRKRGHLYLAPDEVGAISTLRRRAKKDGLRVTQNKTKGSAITDVWLLSGDTTQYLIVRPDAVGVK
jgi:hypothetical protein